MRRSDPARVAFGDWQTPVALATAVIARLQHSEFVPSSVVEPTCGVGAFLAAAAAEWPTASLRGFDVNPAYVQTATAVIPRAQVVRADFFTTPWERELAVLPAPILVVGNPPWVTSSDLGALGSVNLPTKANIKGLRGLDALTGKSNFDVSEWMLRRLLGALEGRVFVLAMLCKTAVARHILEFAAAEGLRVRGELCSFDAMAHFGAAVDAVLLVVASDASAPAPRRPIWAAFADISDTMPAGQLGIVDGVLCSDVDAFERSRGLAGSCDPEWRSGLKHDCSRVMEFTAEAGGWVNGEDEPVELEPDFLFPLLKGSDLANSRLSARRAVLVPQKFLGQPTSGIREQAPRTWEYLSRHRSDLDARKSTIYRDQPPFAIFGVGEYTFSPWKVAICGLYKRLAFVVIGPRESKPVIFDDTCYFLPFAREEEAHQAAEVLRSVRATDFLTSRIFWDAKRPISKAVLQALDLQRLLAEQAPGIKPQRPRQPAQVALGFLG